MIDDQKPKPGSAAETRHIKLFADYLKEIGWHEALKRLDQSDVLIIDPEVLAAVEAATGELSCRVIEPGGLKRLPEGTERILYLCREREWHRTKAARKRFPNLEVLSLTYDVLPMGALPEQQMPRLDAIGQKSLVPPRNLLMTSRGSDAEYLKLSLEKNDLGSVEQVAPRALEPWILLMDHFQVARFMAAVFGKHEHSTSALSFDIGLVQLFLVRTLLKRKTLVAWLKEIDVYMLYFLTRDKLRQSSIRILLKGHPIASVWDQSEVRIAALEDQKFDLDEASNELISILELEMQVERLMENQDHFKIVALEDLVVVPENVLEAIAHFWGGKAPKRANMHNWHARYLAIPEYLDQLAIFRERINDRYSLGDLSS